MATWTDPRGDLRRFLADTSRDNLVKEQKVIGPVSGQNRSFMTFHDRLAASGYQNTQSRPLRVFIADGGGSPVEIAASGINVTDSFRGQFELMLMPSGSQSLTASYYFQQHLDEELDADLQQAADLLTIDTPDNVPKGMKSAAMHLAGAFSHERLAQRMFFRKSDQFLLNDTPAEEAQARITFHRETATLMRTQGLDLRRAFYDLRNDRGRAPAFGLLKRTPKPWGPNR